MYNSLAGKSRTSLLLGGLCKFLSRTTVPLVSYIKKTSSDFCITHPVVHVVKILTKSWGQRKNLRESEGQSFSGSDWE